MREDGNCDHLLLPGTCPICMIALQVPTPQEYPKFLIPEVDQRLPSKSKTVSCYAFFFSVNIDFGFSIDGKNAQPGVVRKNSF